MVYTRVCGSSISLVNLSVLTVPITFMIATCKPQLCKLTCYVTDTRLLL